MIGLPITTEFNKRIPKQKFYENIDISPALKKVFVEQVKTIYWKNYFISIKYCFINWFCLCS